MPTKPNSNAQGTAGVYAAPSSGKGGKENAAKDLVTLVEEMRTNFLDKKTEIMDGLLFNQYDLLKSIHFYLNSKFESGDEDENGNDRFFHNIINHRNAHTTKNIDLDTKDMRVKTELTDRYWASWLFRSDIQGWMRDELFSLNLNQLAEDLPKFGTVVWKKEEYKDEDGEKHVCVRNVDLRDLICDQSVERLKDSQLTAERCVLSAQDIWDKVEYGGWDGKEAKAFIEAAGTVKKKTYLRSRNTENVGEYSLTDSLPSYDVYEVWGWVPETLLPESVTEKKAEDLDKNEYVYVMAVIAGVESGAQSRLLFCEKAEPEDFPYRDVHMRKTPGRWLGVGNTELLIPLQIRANELVNRFFTGIRLGSVHLFQTRSETLTKNLVQDAQDGDIVVSSHPIEPISTEVRAFQQYLQEMQQIETLADRICNTPEVVTGESMPAATPFRLSAQLGTSAAKIFDFVREGCGIFVADILCTWIKEGLRENFSSEHVIDLIGSVEDLAAFDEAYRKTMLYEQVKTYVLKTGYLPTSEEFQVAEKALAEQMKTGDKKVKIEDGYFDEDFLDKAQIYMDPTGESENLSSQNETLGNLLQIIASNPAIMQDPNTRFFIGKIMENAGIPPIKLAGFVSTPQGTPGQMADPASPAAQKFGANPGDADPNGKGLNQNSVAERLAAQSA